VTFVGLAKPYKGHKPPALAVGFLTILSFKGSGKSCFNGLFVLSSKSLFLKSQVSFLKKSRKFQGLLYHLIGFSATAKTTLPIGKHGVTIG